MSTLTTVSAYRRTPRALPSFQAVLPAQPRFSIGLVSLRAFLDKMFDLSYTAPSARAWINGGSPTVARSTWLV